MTGTVTLPLAELDIIREEPNKVRREMKEEISKLETSLLEERTDNVRLVEENRIAKDKAKSITLIVKKRDTTVVPKTEWSTYGSFYYNVVKDNEEVISEVLYKNMDDILETIKKSLDKEQKQSLKNALTQVSDYQEQIKDLKEKHSKEIRVIKDSLNEKDTIEKMQKRINELTKQLSEVKNKSLLRRIFNK